MAIDFTNDILSLYENKVANEAAYQVPGLYNIPAGVMDGDSVAAVSVDNAGSGYTSVPAISFVGEASEDAVATAVMTAVGATVAAAGTGYAEGDTVTLAGGTNSSPVIVSVSAVGAEGAITSVTISDGGDYTVLAANPMAQGSTSGTGTGATFTISWGIGSVTVSDGGSGYASAPTVNVSGNAELSADMSVSVDQSELLTMVEVIRSYFAKIESAEEAKIAQGVLYRMLSRLKTSRGSSAYNGSIIAGRAREMAMKYFAGTYRIKKAASGDNSETEGD